MSDVKFGFPHAKATDKVMDKYKHDTSIKSFEDLADVIDGEFLEVYKDLFLAFSTLSDATTLLLDFDDITRAAEEINHAKKHLLKISKADPELWRRAMVSIPPVCELED